MAGVNLWDLSNLINNPIFHDVTWPSMPTNRPSKIPKFKGKLGEDPSNHVMSFHLWFSSKRIIDDATHFRLFQRTHAEQAAKLYISEQTWAFTNFGVLAKAFLSFFQLPMQHDIGLELLTDFRKTTSTHIMDHIHKWNHLQALYKINVDPKFLLD